MANENALRGLAHIGVETDNIEKSLDFYVNTLGFAFSSKTVLPNGVELAFVEAGSCVVEFVCRPGAKPAGDGVVSHFAIEVKNIDALVADLKTKGVVFDTDAPNLMPDLCGGVKGIFFRGPSGEHLEFFEYLNR